MIMDQTIKSFAEIVSSLLMELINSSGFRNVDLKNQQRIHHLCFLCNLIRDIGQGYELILEEHSIIKVCTYELHKEKLKSFKH